MTFLNKITFYVSLASFLFLAGIANASEPQVLTVEEIETSAVDHLEKILPWDKQNMQINVYYEGEDILLPPGKMDLIYKTGGRTKRAGRIPLTLIIKVNDNFQKRFQIKTRVMVSQEVIKTTKSIRRGETLSDENIQTETILTERPWKDAIENLDNALGYEAKRNLPNGKIITTKFIKKPALANKGEKILIMAEKGGMKITTPGILKEDGYEDAMVQVLNMESKKTIYGRLVDSNTVKVSF